MRFIAMLAVLLAAPITSPSAQIWEKHRDAPQAASPGTPTAAQDVPDTEPQGEPSASTATDAEMPRTAPPPGPGSSLGGSGDTGTDSIGILPARDTDFGRATWRYTPFATVVGLMERLPERIDSAAQHELGKNLLVSIADAPVGDDGGSRLLQLRVRKLLAMGNVVDAAALARAAPGLPDDPDLAHAEIEAELLAGQIESACIDLRAFTAVLTDAVSRSALALCRQHAGETIEGDLPSMDIQALGAAARISGTPLAADPQTSPPPRLVAAALDTRNDPALRLEAAFAAGRASALYGEFLSKLFAASPAAGLSAEGGAPADGASAAALYHAIAQEGAIDRKLALAERGLLSPFGVSDKIGVAMVSPLRAFQPVPELGPMAQRFAILFYTIGDTEAAAPWAELADANGNAALLWPYRVLIKQADVTGIGDWEQASGLDAPHLARVLMILSAFDVTKPPSGSAQVAGDNRPEAAFTDLLGMDQSARDLHVGETVLRALAVLGREGPAQAHPLTLRRVLADLKQVSLHNEAHALAFEAITATLLDGKQNGLDGSQVGGGQNGGLIRYGAGP
ncbi:MAG: Antifreeze glycopeptide polyprotein precursor [Rhodospirillales bacterium]|nr:Antifreeze glycopeptide polyprotein precursor [Rhodospirillales bacterium]